MQVTTVRLPDEIYERLRLEAFEQRTSINALILRALEAVPNGATS